MINLLNFFKEKQFSRENIYTEVIDHMTDFIHICMNIELRKYIIMNELLDFHKCVLLFSIIDTERISLLERLLSNSSINGDIEIDYAIFQMDKENIMSLILITIIHYIGSKKIVINLLRNKIGYLKNGKDKIKHFIAQYYTSEQILLTEKEINLLIEINRVELREGELIILIEFIKNISLIEFNEVTEEYSTLTENANIDEEFNQLKKISIIKQCI
jgi:hypothetical protein